jgi:MFS family permease
MAYFALQPLAFGAWLPCIPDVKAALGLSPGALALCLLRMPVGTALALPFAGRVVAWLGVQRVLLAGYPLFLACALLPVLARSPAGLALALAATGVAMSILELAMNVSADRIERQGGRLIMNTCHGFWSVGMMTGTLAGSAVLALAAPPWVAVGLAGVAALPAALWIARRITIPVAAVLPGPPSAEGPPLPVWADRRLIGLGLFILGIGMTEGAIADWSALYLREVFGFGPGGAGLGYAVFAALLTAGRFAGDGLKARLGALPVARACLLLALAAVGLLVLAPSPHLAHAAFGAVGLGVSVGFPLAVSAAARLPGRPSERSVAALTFMALSGFLIGPVVIGWLAETGGLQLGLAALLPGLMVSLAASGALRAGRPPLDPRQ